MSNKMNSDTDFINTRNNGENIHNADDTQYDAMDGYNNYEGETAIDQIPQQDEGWGCWIFVIGGLVIMYGVAVMTLVYD